MKLQNATSSRLLVLILALLFFSCKTKSQSTMEGKEVSRVGIAKNARAGAVLVTENDGPYYIDGVESWDENIIDKKIEVTGILKTESLSVDDLKNEEGEMTAGISGVQLIILNPTWKVVE